MTAAVCDAVAVGTADPVVVDVAVEAAVVLDDAVTDGDDVPVIPNEFDGELVWDPDAVCVGVLVFEFVFVAVIVVVGVVEGDPVCVAVPVLVPVCEAVFVGVFVDVGVVVPVRVGVRVPLLDTVNAAVVLGVAVGTGLTVAVDVTLGVTAGVVDEEGVAADVPDVDGVAEGDAPAEMVDVAVMDCDDDDDGDRLLDVEGVYDGVVVADAVLDEVAVGSGVSGAHA